MATTQMTETGLPPMPRIRSISQKDISEALQLGVEDFKAVPQFGLTLAVIYIVGGLMLAYFAVHIDQLVLLFPLAAGFALIGPFSAVTLYEVSRRREQGLSLDWNDVLGAIRRASSGSIVMLGFVLFFVLYVWVRTALLIYALVYGLAPVEFVDLLGQVATTWRGAFFFVLGNGVGALFALLIFVISVTSFPYLVDKDADFVTALMVSVQSFAKNPRVMIGWAVFIAFLLGVAILPFFLGLFLALPVLGHATWHLYRRTVEP